MPRALDRRGVLSELVTDFWFSPRSVLNPWSNGLGDRFHPELKEAKVRSANLSNVMFELMSRARDLNGWQLIGRRNDWFQNFAVSELARHAAKSNGTRTNVFAYSYAAVKILKLAKERSWPTVLGQIDPGPTEERIVAQLHEDAGQGHLWEPAPAQYWDDWRSECELADRIVVNSDWSRVALESEGVPATKISVIPLAFEPDREAISFKREYPEEFTEQRPLRVLFLGQINLRKGVCELLEAIKLLSGELVEFWFVGPVQFAMPKTIESESCIKWFGAVPRRDVAKYYQTADLFIFPTFSDGFGLTQLEAQSWKLPVIASSRCGSVVENGVNGLILSEVSGESIAKALLDLRRSPGRLQRMSDQSGLREQFSLQSLSSALVNG
ncbi:MAG TPA: glycosyltransferase family 4 protein [Pyrinomonadaceae bacterium]|nr:glycosyltransferase family 4 protein [Pyrinomonadaceae bacterium]